MLSPLLAPSATGRASIPSASAHAVPVSASGLTWPDWLLRPLARLGTDAATLLTLMLAVNAVLHPYAGLDHDGRLYALQTVERVRPGFFADDLYLKYGSQDRFSVFGPLMAPLVAALGLGAAFFLVYLLSKAILFWGVLRLMGRLIRDPAAVALGALFLAIVPAYFGGNQVLSVNEPFLTPRLAATGLTLLALERLLAGRPLGSLGLLCAAALWHPVMAMGGLLVWMLFELSRRLSPVVFMALLATVGLAATVAVLWRPLGLRLFGEIDDEWRDRVLRTCFFIRPALWTIGDWIRIGWGVVVVVAAAVGFARESGRLLWAMLAAAAIGFVGTAIAVVSPYLLLIQTSPYRNMWLFEFLAIPLGIAWAIELWRRGSGATVAAGLAVLVVATTDWTAHDLRFTATFPVAFALLAISLRGFGKFPRRDDWLPAAAWGGFLAGAIVLAFADLHILTVLWFTAPPPASSLEAHPLVLLREQAQLLAKLPLLLLVVGLLAVAANRTAIQLRLAAVVVFLACQALVFGLEASASYGLRYSERSRRLAFIAEHLRGTDRPAMVYWTGDPRYPWFDLQARSYFSTIQLSGCAFNRATAVEGWRRRELVRPFEVAHWLRRVPPDTSWRKSIWAFFEITADEPAPTRSDLIRLCAAPLLDVVVLPQDFEGLWSATDGTIYVYDCAQVRRLTGNE